ncbi:winged helix-turn-helix domain-containing protein [Paraburkholderia nodosa]|uniref:winged helix-turn-helix domain-containing protein n=1 Tax=Paraburkholderia nodosa TaxID=392320 RepID=UPI0013784953|nr:winged helix-turn-helix domain-containing protein [Paraburkholderia nodosa]
MTTNERVAGPPWSVRRERAAQMLSSGMDIARVASELCLSPATARRCESVFSAGGSEALLRLGDVGRRQQLPAGGIEHVINAIGHAPEVYGFSARSWTNELVRNFIEREFGVRYSYSHVNRLLRDHRQCVPDDQQ